VRDASADGLALETRAARQGKAANPREEKNPRLARVVREPLRATARRSRARRQRHLVVRAPAAPLRALRGEPLARAWSRYWYEGRWGGGAALHGARGGGGGAAPAEPPPLDEAAWLANGACRAGRYVGNRCVSNYYVRTFSGAEYGGRGAARCEGESDECNAGVPRSDLTAAIAFLERACSTTRRASVSVAVTGLCASPLRSAAAPARNTTRRFERRAASPD
jgi:hypothetical protein